MILKSAVARFDEVTSVLRFDDQLRSNPETRSSARSAEWRRLLYSGAIINMYGALEQFVDDTIEKYASLCGTFFKNYDLVPEALRKSHDEQARKLLNRDGGGRLSREDTDQMVRCLASCLDGGEGYQLSGTALSYHDNNLKMHVLSEMFGRVNVLLDGIVNSLRLDEFENGALKGIYGDMDSLLLDLVNRRNEISHGDYADLAGPEVLTAMAEVLKWLVTSLTDELRKSTFNSIRSVDVGYVQHYFDEPQAHLVKLQSAELSVGDVLFGLERGTQRLRAARITSLQDDSTAVDLILRDSMRDAEGIVGLTVSPVVKFGGKISTIPSDCADILYDDAFRSMN
ncbi:HEPN domain-containing protein [Streptomyces sp. NBC_01618]|uniref:HEPN domain-containing protein n=1 Tax=Streptomyces sp. NBC_01618 TaxID=2975900 RepID=UPI003865D0F4|nr:HEPN domain-containing protein [Streptomyces sp. NBC_01618]